MSAALEVPQRIRDSWAAELAAEQHAAEVAQARAEREQALREELAETLPTAHAAYLAAVERARETLDLCHEALRRYAEARALYVSVHGRAVALDAADHVREPALDAGNLLRDLLTFGAAR